MKRVILDIPDDQAMGLAQLCKRFCWKDAVRFANPHDGGRERDAILDGTLTLQRALREAGLRHADPELEDSVPTSNRILQGGMARLEESIVTNTTNLSRRRLLASMPAAAAATAPVATTGLCRLPAETDDPIFTLIAEHREAMRAERLFATETTSRTRQWTFWR